MWDGSTGIHFLFSCTVLSLGHNCNPEAIWLLVYIVISHVSDQNDLWKCSCKEDCQAKILGSGKFVIKISRSL